MAMAMATSTIAMSTDNSCMCDCTGVELIQECLYAYANAYSYTQYGEYSDSEQIIAKLAGYNDLFETCLGVGEKHKLCSSAEELTLFYMQMQAEYKIFLSENKILCDEYFATKDPFVANFDAMSM